MVPCCACVPRLPQLPLPGPLSPLSRTCALFSRARASAALPPSTPCLCRLALSCPALAALSCPALAAPSSLLLPPFLPSPPSRPSADHLASHRTL
eukprot:362154-Chlamydomonas_euryale.AAC.1